MASKPRISAPDVFYHITARGIPERDIFPTLELKRFFLEQLAISLKRYEFTCLGWSLQKNHYHLILKSKNHSISKIMQRLNSAYAIKFNSEFKRKGVVFYRRFASVIVQDTHLRELIRYVHYNPVRCEECTINNLDHYEFSGHSAVLGNCENDLLDKENLLKLFNSSQDARKAYSDFLKEGTPGCAQDEVIAQLRKSNQNCQNSSKPQLWILGDSDFVRSVIEKSQRQDSVLARHLQMNISRENLHQIVEKVLSVPSGSLLKQARGNNKSTARVLFAFIGVTVLDFKAVDLARYLGISGSAVSKMISRFLNDQVGFSFLKKIKAEIR